MFSSNQHPVSYGNLGRLSHLALIPSVLGTRSHPDCSLEISLSSFGRINGSANSTPLYLCTLPASGSLLSLRRPWEDSWNEPVISSWFKLKCLLCTSTQPCVVERGREQGREKAQPLPLKPVQAPQRRVCSSPSVHRCDLKAPHVPGTGEATHLHSASSWVAPAEHLEKQT